jgi:hypothetical protein
MVSNRIFEPPDLLVVSLHGLVTSSDQAALVAWVRDTIRRRGEVRVLVMLEQFVGWDASAPLADAQLWLSDDEGVTKLAVVGERKWRSTILTMVAQPVRSLPIEYFETEKAARRWLTAESTSTASALFI